VKGALIPIVALTRGFPLAPFGWSGTPETVPMTDRSFLRSRGETWGPVSPENAEKTGVWSVGQPGFPVVAAEAVQVERTRRKTWSRARSEVSVPYSLRFLHFSTKWVAARDSERPQLELRPPR
jgi:hypothetical protein